MKGQLSSLLLPLFQEIHNPKNSHKEKKMEVKNITAK